MEIPFFGDKKAKSEAMPIPRDGIKSCLTDMPLNPKMQNDELNSMGYAAALADFIRNADTPVTIGIQGGWGSGKTSLFFLLKKQLEADTEHSTVCIEVNAWEHSLFHGNEGKATVVLSILNGLISKIQELEKKPWLDAAAKTNIHKECTEANQILKKIASVLPTMAQVGMQFIVPGANLTPVTATAAAAAVKETVQVPVLAEQIHNLKEKLEKLAGYLSYGGKQTKVVIFIDDLDRVPPPTAVEILDVTKNIFDIGNCVFVMAIDYEVVVKGLEDKFGKRGEENEREFRQYFDKIIQIPFTMPIGAYSSMIHQMLANALSKLNYDFGEGKNKKILENLVKAAELSTGGIPRSIKRIINTLSLLEYIHKIKYPQVTQEKLLKSLEARFIVVGLHLNFPEICRRLMEEPKFTSWKKHWLEIPWNLDFDNHEKELNALKNNRYFDEEWEKVVFCLCAEPDWLKAKAANVSRLLNLLRDVLLEQRPEEEITGEENALSDDEANALRELMESIRVISIDSDTQNQELGGAAYMKSRITAFCREIDENIRAQVTAKYENPVEECEAELDEEAWCYRCGIDGDISWFGVWWDPKSCKLQVYWYATRFGKNKAESEQLLSEETKGTPFNFELEGKQGTASFDIIREYIGFSYGDFDDATKKDACVKAALDAYKLTKKCVRRFDKER